MNYIAGHGTNLLSIAAIDLGRYQSIYENWMIHRAGRIQTMTQIIKPKLLPDDNPKDNSTLFWP